MATGVDVCTTTGMPFWGRAGRPRREAVDGKKEQRRREGLIEAYNGLCNPLLWWVANSQSAGRVHSETSVRPRVTETASGERK
jgi:hypothetical protein